MTSDKKRTRPRPLTPTEEQQAVDNLMEAGAERDQAVQIVNSLQWSAAPSLCDEAPLMTPGETDVSPPASDPMVSLATGTAEGTATPCFEARFGSGGTVRIEGRDIHITNVEQVDSFTLGRLLARAIDHGSKLGVWSDQIKPLSDAAKERAVDAVMRLREGPATGVPRTGITVPPGEVGVLHEPEFTEPFDRGPAVATHPLPWSVEECDLLDADGDLVCTVGCDTEAVAHRVNIWDALCDRLERAIIERDEAQAHITCRRSERLGAERDRLRESLRAVRAEADARLTQEMARRDRLLRLQRERWRARLAKLQRESATLEVARSGRDVAAQLNTDLREALDEERSERERLYDEYLLTAARAQDLLDLVKEASEALKNGLSGAAITRILARGLTQTDHAPVDAPARCNSCSDGVPEHGLPTCAACQQRRLAMPARRAAPYARHDVKHSYDDVSLAGIIVDEMCGHCGIHRRRGNDAYCSDECAAEVGADC